MPQMSRFPSKKSPWLHALVSPGALGPCGLHAHPDHCHLSSRAGSPLLSQGCLGRGARGVGEGAGSPGNHRASPLQVKRRGHGDFPRPRWWRAGEDPEDIPRSFPPSPSHSPGRRDGPCQRAEVAVARSSEPSRCHHR